VWRRISISAYAGPIPMTNQTPYICSSVCCVRIRTRIHPFGSFISFFSSLFFVFCFIFIFIPSYIHASWCMHICVYLTSPLHCTAPKKSHLHTRGRIAIPLAPLKKLGSTIHIMLYNPISSQCRVSKQNTEHRNRRSSYKRTNARTNEPTN